MKSTAELALEYTRRGWYVVPVRHRSKRPTIPRWQDLRITEADLTTHFNGGPQNIGVLLGEPSNWLVDVDLDHPVAVAMGGEYLPATGAVFGRSSKRASHFLYRVTGPVDTAQFKTVDRVMLVELRSTGAQTIFPGSTHAGGEVVEWGSDGDPAMIDPVELLARVQGLAERVAAKIGKAVRGTARDSDRGNTPSDPCHDLIGNHAMTRAWSYIVKLPDAISGQGGHDATFRAACECFRFGLSHNDAIEAMYRFNNEKCMPAWTEKEIAHKVKDAQSQVHADGEVGMRLRTSEETHRSDIRIGAQTQASRNVKPVVVLPGVGTPITHAAAELGRLFVSADSLFVRGGTVVSLEYDEEGTPHLKPVRPASLASDFEAVATLVRKKSRDPKKKPITTVCSESMARLIMHADAFTNELPPIRVVVPCPVLVERPSGELVEVVGYDRDSGVLAAGEPTENLSLVEARRLIESVVDDFRFASDGDRSRAIAAIITPALVLGDLLPGRAPVDLGEANDSQTGKGFRNKLTAAIYNQKVATITQRKGGVGSLEESFSSVLIRGANFICLDNVRGQINSPTIESFLTEDRYAARVPYSDSVEIDPRRVVVMITSNNAEITRDLANRSSAVRILKQPAGFRFRTFPEGDILDHVRIHHRRFLGAVFSTVRAWHAAGKPRTRESRHDFRGWAQTLDWIVQKLLQGAPIMDGHQEIQRRMTTPSLTWLRELVIAIDRRDRLDGWLRATEVLGVLIAVGSTDIPGACGEDADLDDPNTCKKAARGIGRRLAQCFQDRSSLTIDAFLIERREETDELGRPRRTIRVTRPESSKTPKSPQVGPKTIPNEKHGFPKFPKGLPTSVISSEGDTYISGMGIDSGTSGNGGTTSGKPSTPPLSQVQDHPSTDTNPSVAKAPDRERFEL
jgi:Bifunctional DNA primase/polymerase, N-terminal